MKKSFYLLSFCFVALLAISGSTHLVNVRAAEASLQYQLVDNWAQLPSGTQWGVMSAVDIDTDGTIYVFQRSDPTSAIMVFDASGKLLRTWAQGDFPSAHGLRVSPDHAVWVTDRKLQQAIKYDESGKILMSLGTKNVPGDNTSETSFNGVSDIAIGKNGDIFLSDGEGPNTRVVKFSKDGTFIKMWGTKGTEPGQFNLPHNLAIDPQGHIWVCDRLNKRVQIFNQDGKFLDQMTQFGAASAIFIAKDGTVYVADAAPENRIIIGKTDGKLLGTIDGLNGAHGLAVDSKGSIYVAESGGKTVSKYIRK
jgi:DNA-binding beta-propeller fold protein YncE